MVRKLLNLYDQLFLQIALISLSRTLSEELSVERLLFIELRRFLALNFFRVNRKVNGRELVIFNKALLWFHEAFHHLEVLGVGARGVIFYNL